MASLELRLRSDFLFAVEDQVGIPLSATIFIPTDFDTADLSSSSTNRRRLSVAYHIVIGNKWDTYLDLLQADYTEGKRVQGNNKKLLRCFGLNFILIDLSVLHSGVPAFTVPQPDEAMSILDEKASELEGASNKHALIVPTRNKTKEEEIDAWEFVLASYHGRISPAMTGFSCQSILGSGRRTHHPPVRLVLETSRLDFRWFVDTFTVSNHLECSEAKTL
ncbi:hypothetical protein YC2023_118645 [Brassica napus]